jgi:aryl-alcohol dehydrogenase-like predicted oxidoreductase
MMPTRRVPGASAPVSGIVLGTMSYRTYEDAAPVFDAFFAAGGTAFDTAHKYGNGRADTILGRWLRERGVRDRAVVVGKGAHAPDCTPEGVRAQLPESLERLGTERVDLYFLHQDNAAVPVGEFVDVLDEAVRAGRIGSFGGSNWRRERVDAANEYAASHGREKMRHVSNQFSLAEMVEAVWPGNVSAGDDASMAWLARTGITLFAWSAQARGFFGPRAGRDRRDDAELVRSWYSDANFARRDRAEALARAHGTTLAAVALAYVLAQGFPTHAVIGARDVAQLEASLAALRTPLDETEARRLWAG